MSEEKRPDGADRRLYLNPVPCTGCLCCVDACAQRRAGCSDPLSAAIRVVLDPFGGSHRHIFCRHCPGAPCASACPSGAFHPSPGTGAVAIDESACTGCGSCASVCPFEAIFLPPGEAAIKCDLCGGQPACAEACNFGALRFLPRNHPQAGFAGMPEDEQDVGLGRDGEP